jgi:deoxyribodipyrimidine photo-lyase
MSVGSAWLRGADRALRVRPITGTSVILALKLWGMGSQGQWPDAGGGTAIVLLTRDLRLDDQPALAAACRGRQKVIPLFVHDPALLNRSTASPDRRRFLVDALEDLRRSLRERGGQLFVRYGNPTAETMKVAAETGAATIFLSDDVSRYARRRHDYLSTACARQRVRLVTFPGATVVTSGLLVPAGADHYRVFTPYWQRWRSERWRPPVAPPRRVPVPAGLAPGSIGPPGAREGQASSSRLTRGGETEARTRARLWLRLGLAGYETGHDDLAGEGTSRLSSYLHFGCLSPNQLAHQAVGRDGAEPFLRQLCWRDFHHQVLAAFPDLPHADYRPGRRQWRDDPDGLDAWRSGQTGIPIVDAGMRQLRSEGWMHNRARLLTAAFLTKDLNIAWRLGAEHFMDWLVDADVANNFGNWQWVAGTGNDTRPNRRFNLLRQAHRFDPRGDYVRRYVTELAAVPGPAVHEPWKLERRTGGLKAYPAPIIDLSTPT